MDISSRPWNQTPPDPTKGELEIVNSSETQPGDFPDAPKVLSIQSFMIMLYVMVLESQSCIQIKYVVHYFEHMSGLEALSVRLQFRTPVAAPTYWCVSCQLSLRTIDERNAHQKLFPVHMIKESTRLMCPRCGNYLPLENGSFPDHWVGSSQDMRKCRSSGRKI